VELCANDVHLIAVEARQQMHDYDYEEDAAILEALKRLGYVKS
jgi:hypothetical protein